jgi:glutamate-ammonia-ligase adenylyltransferase
MALTRARPVYGSDSARAELQSIVNATLLMERDRKKLLADALKMRAEMAMHKPPSGPFDIKLGEGGLVDLEFAVHILQLSHGVGLKPQLDRAVAELVTAGYAPPEIEEAHRLLTRMLITFRLVSPTSAEPPEASRPLVASSCGLKDWHALLASHAEARRKVREFWNESALE